MANVIKLRRSAVPGNVPTVEQIDLGEIAINTYDGKLFLKKNDGVETIVEIGSGGGSGGIEEAPQDGNYYVRQDGTWVNLADALAALDDRNVDGGDFTNNTTTAESNYTVNGGNFS